MSTSTTRILTRVTLISCVILALVMGALASPSQAQKVRGTFFGMHDSNLANGGVPTVKLGAVRLWDGGTAWRQIESVPGVYDWSKVDSAVNTARAAHLKPLLVLGQTPQFYAENPTAPGAYGDGASSMPQLSAWKNYVSAAATRYGTTVDYEIWNEPNVIGYWSGTMKQMGQLTAVASKAITAAAGKKATVAAPGFPMRLEGQQVNFKKYWHVKSGGKGMAAYVDVVNLHLYPAADQAPEASEKLLSIARKALPQAARKKPIWNSEINYGLISGGAPAKQISQKKQSAFVARTFLLNAGHGIQRLYWYAWAQGNIANVQLVDSDRTTLLKAGHAWQTAHDWLIGTKFGACKKAGSGKLKGVYTCVAKKGRTEVRRFYWKPKGKAVRITTVKSTKSWTELNGDKHGKKGSYKILVGQSPIMVTSRR